MMFPRIMRDHVPSHPQGQPSQYSFIDPFLRYHDPNPTRAREEHLRQEAQKRLDSVRDFEYSDSDEGPLPSKNLTLEQRVHKVWESSSDDDPLLRVNTPGNPTGEPPPPNSWDSDSD